MKISVGFAILSRRAFQEANDVSQLIMTVSFFFTHTHTHVHIYRLQWNALRILRLWHLLDWNQDSTKTSPGRSTNQPGTYVHVGRYNGVVINVTLKCSLLPSRRSLALAPLYGVSQGIMLLGYIIAFRFGAHQVTLDEDSVLYSDFQSVLRVFSAIVFASISVGLSGSLAPDYAAAKVSARKVLELLERQPDPDGYSEEGVQLVSLTSLSL